MLFHNIFSYPTNYRYTYDAETKFVKILKLLKLESMRTGKLLVGLLIFMTIIP